MAILKDFLLDSVAAGLAATITIKWHEGKKEYRDVPTWELLLLATSLYIGIMTVFFIIFKHRFGY